MRKNDKRSDIYFSGCILYHMLSGRSPLFETRDRIKRLSVARFRDVTPLGQLVPGLPGYVIAFCNRAMDLRPERRFQSPGEMLEELNHIMKRLQAGDMGTPVAAHDEAVSEEVADDGLTAQDTPLEREGENRTVMLVESSIAMQDAIREALKRRGYRVLVFSSPSRALQRFHDHIETEPLADGVIFSAGELGDEAIEAFNVLGEADATRHVPAILLVDRRNKDQIRRARTSEHRILLPLGLKIRQLRSSLYQLLQQRAPTES